MPDLLAPGHRLVVGYSGGQDSTCLLHALVERGLDVVAAHVDHGLRPESAEQAQQVASIATSFGIDCQVRRIDLPSYQAQTGWGIQQAARAARYQVLSAMVGELEAEALLVAHTADDQAETLLLRLLRGAGLAGLAGMRLEERIVPATLGPPLPNREDCPPLGRLRLARPLLSVERATTAAYCADVGVPVVEDASNLSRAYTRNRVRLDLLPVLERFNPGIRGVLARSADLLAEDDAALERLVEDVHARLARGGERRDEIEYPDLAAWRAQPRAIQRRLLRLGVRRLLGSLVDVPAAPVEDALDGLASGGAGRAYHLPNGVELRTRRDGFVLRRGGQARPRARPNSWGNAIPRV